MNSFSVIAPASSSNPSGTNGVDMLSNPFTLGARKLRSAVNLRFEEGVIRTRPAFHYHRLGLSGVFQGMVEYAPSMGLSAKSFAPRTTAMILVVDGLLHAVSSTSGEPAGRSVTLTGSYSFKDLGAVTVYQAENWLVLQNPFSNTMFWDGTGSLMESPGMASQRDTAEECDTTTPDEMIDGMGPGSGVGVPRSDGHPRFGSGLVTSVSSVIPGFPYVPTPSGGCAGDSTNPSIDGGVGCSVIGAHSHDSFLESKHRNWLVNGACLGIYAHGRVHQDAHGSIYVSDLVHKRGYLATDDVLKMEEQSLPSMGDPLTVSSRMGGLRALAILPAMGTANGEGDLIAYYENGVVAFETSAAPRETRLDADGAVIQKGWDQKRLVNHLLNTVSAVGPHAVAVMPRDHFFRSYFGLHFLKVLLGEGSFAPEHINRLSQPLQPVLDSDPKDLLFASAVGTWLKGGRLFASVGLHESECHSAVPMSCGFVSINQASGFTEDRTPLSAAEGVWVLDHEMQGLHRFVRLGATTDASTFGFVASDRDTDLFFAAIDPNGREDVRDDDFLPIEWSAETGSFQVAGGNTWKLTEGVLEIVTEGDAVALRVLVRTDLHSEWSLWRDIPAKGQGRQLRVIPLGQPKQNSQVGSWFQFRLEGSGYVEIHAFKVGGSDAGGKAGQEVRVPVESCPEDFFITNREPFSKRWSK